MLRSGDGGLGVEWATEGLADEILVIGIDTVDVLEVVVNAPAADAGLEYEAIVDDVLLFAISSARFKNFCAFSLISSFFLWSFSSIIRST